MNDGFNYAEMLCKLGLKHTIRSCPNSTTIDFETKNAKGETVNKQFFFPFGDKVEQKYLNFISKTKIEICQNSKRLGLKYKKPVYIGCAPSENLHYKNCVEIDISSAYWKQAFIMGIISEPTYEKGLTMPKKVRLIAFGSAATQKTVFKYDGENYKYEGVESDEHGRAAFFTVGAEVGKLIQSITWSVDYALFWVDAIIVKHWYWADVVEREIRKAGFDCKQKKLAWLKYTPPTTERGAIYTACEIQSETDNLTEYKVKKFTFPGKNNAEKREKTRQQLEKAINLHKNL